MATDEWHGSAAILAHCFVSANTESEFWACIRLAQKMLVPAKGEPDLAAVVNGSYFDTMFDVGISEFFYFEELRTAAQTFLNERSPAPFPKIHLDWIDWSEQNP
jgi:hypothetical protein